LFRLNILELLLSPIKSFVLSKGFAHCSDYEIFYLDCRNHNIQKFLLLQIFGTVYYSFDVIYVPH